MNHVSRSRVARAIIAAGCLAATVACTRTGGKDDGHTATRSAGTHSDSSGGEPSQYLLMTNPVGWLTDSNLVALATIVNGAPISLARLESVQWTDQQVHDFALEVLRDHVALQATIDSIAARHRVPSQRPAVAESVQAPYDSIIARLTGVPLQQVDAKFLALMDEAHERALTDFAALSGNATDPDLRAVFAVRALGLEQRHLARAKQLAAAVASADSAKQAARSGRKP